MNGSGWNENSVTGLRSKGRELVRHCSVRERPAQNIGRGGRLQARVDAAFHSRFQHHPGFGLAALARRQIIRLPIRWMYLNRERCEYIEKLQQQREPVEMPG